MFIRHNDLGVSNLKVIHAYSTETGEIDNNYMYTHSRVYRGKTWK